jgi:translocation and assembly module TamB
VRVPPVDRGGVLNARGRRWAKRAASIAAVLLLVLALALAGGLFLLSSRTGGEWIRGRAVAELQESVQGRPEVGSLDLQGSELVLRGLTLHDPEGELVAEVAEVRLKLAVGAAVRRRLRVTAAAIQSPRLYLKVDERGLNLTRALRARTPRQDQAQEPSSLSVQVDRLTLEDGFLELIHLGEDEDRRVRLEGLAGTGEAAYDGPARTLASTLALEGRVAAPLQGPLALRASFGMEQESMSGALALRAPGLEVDARGERRSAAAGRLEVRTVRLDPEAGRAAFAAYPLQVPATLSGAADLEGSTVRAELRGGAGKATLHGQGSLDTRRLWSDGLTLTARGVDLSELVENGPRSDLQLALAARGGGTSLERLAGEVTLSVPASQLSGETLGPVDLSASAAGGAFTLSTLRASLPGVELRASGEGTARQVALSGELKARDLGALARTLGRMGRGPPLQLDGRGELAFDVVGPLRRPGLSARGAFPALRYGAAAARDLRLTADVEDVTRPLTAEASLQATELRAGPRQLRRVLAAVASDGRELRSDVRFTPVLGGDETGPLALRAAGRVDEDGRGLLLRELVLSYPEAEWTLQRPARLAFRDGVSAEPIALRSGAQAITAAGTLAGDAFSGSADLERVDLRRLPSAFVDPSLDLAGLLDARLQARGTLQRPEVAATVELTGGRFKTHDGLGLSLDGRYARDRASGTLAATSPVGRLSARFDAPVQGLLRGRREPVEVHVDLEEHAIEDALAAAGRPERVTGRAHARLSVTGTAADPLVRVAIAARNVQLPDVPELKLQGSSLDLAVESGEDGTLSAQVDAAAAGGSVRAVVRTPFRARELIARPPDLEQLLATALEAEVSAREVPLELLEAFGVEGAQGRLDLRAEVRGTPRRPTFTAHLDGRQVRVRNAPPSELAVHLVSTDRRTDAALTARRGAAELARLTASLEAPLGDLGDAARLEQAALTLDGQVHSLSLAEWIPVQPDPEGGRSRAPAGTATVRLRGWGTLADPGLELRSTVTQLRVGDAHVGDASVELRYARAQAALTLAVAGTGAGRLAVDGQASVDLSLPAVRRGVAYREAPFDVTLRADQLELGVLTDLVPSVRAVSGKLFADARVTGTLASSSQRGWLEWRNGALALDGYGDYRDVQLRAEATDGGFELKRLSAASGAGRLEVSAQAVRKGDHLELTGRSEMKKFPVVVDDQLMAVVSARLSLEGDLSARLVDIQNLTIPEAHIELPEVKRKDLQDIDRPDDIVLVRQGQPVERKARRLSAGATAEQAAGQDAPAGGEAAGGEAEPRRYHFVVKAPRNLWVRGTDVNVELGLSEGFRLEYVDRSRIYGQVKIIRGRVEVLGREFELQRDSAVAFSGPVRRPFVSATAVHRNEREEVTVFLTIRGEGKDVTLKTTSQPPLTESEIYTLLATGRRTLKRGAGVSTMNTGDAVSLLGSLAANQLKRTLAANVPLDVLTIEAGGGEDLTGTRVEAGRYLSDKAYLGWEVRFGADPRKGQNNVGFRFEYELSPRLSFQTEYGDARSGGADVIWSRDY